MVRITVVVPMRNEARRLPACIRALAAQTLPRSDFEVLFVDGDSTDGSSRIVEEAGFEVVQAAVNGVSGARNEGILAARGDIVAFTDADCRPQEDWLVRILRRFDHDEALGGLGGMVRHPHEAGAPLASRVEDAGALAFYRGYITSNAAYRRGILLEVGGFDMALCCAEDCDLAWRVAEAGYLLDFDPRAVVEHEPPEERSLGAWLGKHFWYARKDVYAFRRALLRRRALDAAEEGGEASHPSDPLVQGHGLPALKDALEFSVLTLGLLDANWPALVAGGAFSIGRAYLDARTMGTYARYVENMPSRNQAAALLLARSLVRGAGTWLGLAEVALRAWRGEIPLPQFLTLPEAPPRNRPAREGVRSESDAPVEVLDPFGQNSPFGAPVAFTAVHDGGRRATG
jgi:glycosyltransferase involved in cell wall biosynthesis